MEIITGIERRRRWRTEEKLRIVAEADAPGAVIAQVARRHGVERSQIFDWRRKAQSGELMAVPVVPEFLPMRMSEAAEAPLPPVAEPLPSAAGHVELSFPGGITLRRINDQPVSQLHQLLPWNWKP